MRFSNKRAFADVDAPSGPVRLGPPARAGGPAVPPTADTAMALVFFG